jgi:ribosomal protein S18 acetylase RimI-like enzyme
MLEYLTIRKYKHTKHLINLWNSEFRSTYPIKKQLYRNVVLNDVHLNKDASFVALYDNEPVGFIFIKTWIDESGLADEHETAHISLIFVKKEMRNMGIGSDMLKLALSEIKKYHNIITLVV